MAQEWSEEKARVSEIKENITQGMKVIINSAMERDKYVDDGMDKFQECSNRHRVEIDKSHCQEKELKERVEVLEAQVESMSNKLCHCGQESPMFEEDGGLEYADSPGEYHTPSNTSPITAPPEENEAPIPIPDRAESIPNASDQENVPPSNALVVRRLVSIEEVEERDPRITSVGQHTSRRRDRRVNPYPHLDTLGRQEEHFHQYLWSFEDSRVAASKLHHRKRDFCYIDSLCPSSTDVGRDHLSPRYCDDSHHSLSG
jgi:hypothetical protein